MEDAAYTIDDCVLALTPYLTNSWQRQRTPNGLDEALPKARSESASATARIFLDSGFQAWLAYFLATRDESHHKGLGAKRKAVATLQQLPEGHKRQVAQRLANIEPHITVQTAIESLQNAPKRRREWFTYIVLLHRLTL